MTNTPESAGSAALVLDIGTGRPLPPITERRSYAEPFGRASFTMVTRAGREMAVGLSAQPVFDLARSTAVARRIRRSVRNGVGGGAGGPIRRALEPADFKRIDLQTLKSGLELLRLGAGESGVMPAFWRTVSASPGHFALLCQELRGGAGTLLVEVVGNVDHAPDEALRAAMPSFESGGLGMMLHIAPDLGAARRMAPLRPQCLAIDFAGVDQESVRGWQEAAQLIGAARLASEQVMLLNLRPERGMAAEMAGATHAVFADMQAISV